VAAKRGAPALHRFTVTPIQLFGSSSFDRGTLSRMSKLACAATTLILFLLAGCATPVPVDDPVGMMGNVNLGPRDHLAALQTMDMQPDNPEYHAVMHEVMWRPGYIVSTREKALDRLAERDLDNLKRTIRQRLPNMRAWGWHERLCEIVAERGWDDLTPALISSWARPWYGFDEDHRPEYLALRRLHGDEALANVVFDLFLASSKSWEFNLRGRCWELLHRLEQRERLLELLRSVEVMPEDAMLADLRAAATDLGIVPYKREEILWVMKLREPARAEFWSSAVQAIQGLPPEKRAQLELRDLPTVVVAHHYEPELLASSESQLLARVESMVKGRKRHIRTDSLAGYGDWPQELYQWRHELTWGDLAAILCAVRALNVPEVRTHLFDYAERDRLDESTEYGGILELDEQRRFVVREFVPTVRVHDQEFRAAQAMFDAGYTAQFHFHFHAQRYDNDEYAGPGLGDVDYADATRVNCIVLTFVDDDRMNVDFYRHGRVIVDLGEIERP
jgi:hypothetical protein